MCRTWEFREVELLKINKSSKVSLKTLVFNKVTDPSNIYFVLFLYYRTSAQSGKW